MNEVTKTIVLYIATFTSSIFGAYMSFRISRHDLSPIFSYFFNCIHTTLWLAFIFTSKGDLIKSAAWFDVLVALGYFVGFYMMGCEMNYNQFIGILLLLIGLYMLN